MKDCNMNQEARGYINIVNFLGNYINIERIARKEN
jgi:hypothetical protein